MQLNKLKAVLDSKGITQTWLAKKNLVRVWYRQRLVFE